MVNSNNGNRWYARRNGTVRGPFTDENITRYILLGRIRLKDELSQDRIRWRSVGDYPGLFPEELLQLSSWEDYQTLVVARMKVDERLEERRIWRVDLVQERVGPRIVELQRDTQQE